MSTEMKAALIGLAGAFIGAVITYIATIQSTKKQLAALRGQAERDRIAREQDTIVLFMADFLTEVTADQAKHDPEILDELDHQLERLVKSLHIKGHPEMANEVSRKGRDYLLALRLYARDGMSQHELSRHRIRARDEIKDVVLSFSRI
jgi:hypothetical protein